MSFPWGKKQDCISANDLLQKTKKYELVFTTNTIINTKEIFPYKLESYQPIGTDTTQMLNVALKEIINKSKN